MQSYFPLGCYNDETSLVAFIILNDFMMEMLKFREWADGRSTISCMIMHSCGSSLKPVPSAIKSVELELPVSMSSLHCSFRTHWYKGGDIRCKISSLKNHQTGNSNPFYWPNSPFLGLQYGIQVSIHHWEHLDVCLCFRWIIVCFRCHNLYCTAVNHHYMTVGKVLDRLRYLQYYSIPEQCLNVKNLVYNNQSV